MSKPVFSDLFTFSGRRNRKSYVLYYLATVALIIGGLLLSTAVTAISPTAGLVLWVIYVVLMIAVLVSSFAVSAQRIRDFGYSGCWVFIYLIPYVGFAASIALFFIPSSEGENKYGPSLIQQ
jgi:uncharacterized membrane protein YhaH (DUF805 family)